MADDEEKRIKKNKNGKRKLEATAVTSGNFLIATPHTSGIPDAKLYFPTAKIWELEAKVRTYDGDFEPVLLP